MLLERDRKSAETVATVLLLLLLLCIRPLLPLLHSIPKESADIPIHIRLSLPLQGKQQQEQEIMLQQQEIMLQQQQQQLLLLLLVQQGYEETLRGAQRSSPQETRSNFLCGCLLPAVPGICCSTKTNTSSSSSSSSSSRMRRRLYWECDAAAAPWGLTTERPLL